MRVKHFIFLCICIITISLYASPKKGTYEYYAADPDCIGRTVTLYITECYPTGMELHGYVEYNCYTATKDELGGIASVYVRRDKSKTFFNNYGKVKARNTINGKSSNYWDIKPVTVLAAKYNGILIFIKDPPAKMKKSKAPKFKKRKSYTIHPSVGLEELEE